MSIEFEAGKYRARVKGVKVGTAKSSGNSQIVWSLEPIGQYSADDGELYELDAGQVGKTRTCWATITDKTLERRTQEVLSLSDQVEDFVQLDPDLAGDRFVDVREKEVDCTCRHDTYQGRESEKWELLVSGGGSGKDKVAPRPEGDALRELKMGSAAMIKKLKGQKKDGVPF